MSAQELRKTLTMRYRRQQICSALFGYGRIVSREPMTTSEHWVDSANATMLKNIASELAFGGGDDALEAQPTTRRHCLRTFRPPERDI
jgi:hypothetical protein